MEETEEGVELREVGEEGKKRRNGWSAGEDRVEAFLRRRRGGTEVAEVPGCHFCGERLSDGPVPLSLGRELSLKHRKEKHPDVTPRDIQSMRKELEEREKAARRRQSRERESKTRLQQVARPGRERIRRKSHFAKSDPRSRQPELTEEMIQKMRALYGEMGSIARVAERCYAEFGFSSPERLRVVLSRARKDRGVILGIPRNRRRLTAEIIEEAKRLYKEERISILEISRRYRIDWEYSLKDLRNVLHQIFKDHGVELREEPRRTLGRPSKMISGRVEIAWQLYSVGNFSLREISEMSYESWGVGKSGIGEALKKAGRDLRASRWDNDGSRPISREEAIRMIKSVS